MEMGDVSIPKKKKKKEAKKEENFQGRKKRLNKNVKVGGKKIK